ncbi:MAG TPA: DUF4142 domain-containing protein [Myxococcales bacterium]
MLTHRLSLALALVLLGGAAWAAEGSKLSDSDRKFIHEAAQGGQLEVRLGDLVAQKATDAEVKAFGERMVTDHGKVNQELKTLASQVGEKLPTALSKKGQASYDKLHKLTGAAFDREYMAAMVRDHERDVKAFDHETRYAKDPRVRTFAENTLPTLHEHLRIAKEIDAKFMKGVGGTGGQNVPLPPPPSPEK